jgi:hypothetical protein
MKYNPTMPFPKPYMYLCCDSAFWLRHHSKPPRALACFSTLLFSCDTIEIIYEKCMLMKTCRQIVSLRPSPDTVMDLRSHLKPGMSVPRPLKYSVVVVNGIVHVFGGENASRTKSY